ncbi:DEAD/DEAH box helicase [Actinokineospora sp. NBRC 105648]|uniref:DEAD/DEAH box helicase n=1 Tax=Actinokineospora sp. NBRC 105648 TaxID=3032206 RepID=UPI0024A30A21|nr:DEAD/DEAH box helicase [Actinokineospora sp. NBRC 105648]GLZ41158.1 ATP-dependent helicase [Actinokineospora sp. NBRC 105648]
MSIDLLNPVLAHHIVNTLGWRSLRPLQQESVAPLLAGDDAVLLAPTAGGKTEAAVFPLLTAMEASHSRGLSVLYVCPLKALLNNLLPRLESYAGWTGRRVALWHGDVSQPRRQAILRDPPDILLTTPESIESMLVSTKVDHRRLFADLRAIVIDEVHAFAADDRGWHLLAVLERLTEIAGGPIQRIGLSATVGNPDDLLTWLQGSGAGRRPARVVAPVSDAAVVVPEIDLDYVGTIDNAARVISALHRGEKRLVFCDSRARVEEIGAALRAYGVTTFLSHASLSIDERRRAETAFAEARDCVIVSTSTLELGIDVGDLDRVIQIGAPGTVASFLQRLGRTGRRPGGTRNCLFLAVRKDELLAAAGLLLLWSRGFVEAVIPPPDPRHIVAQQLLALCLQESTIGDRTWQDWWHGLGPFASANPIFRHLVEHGFLDQDDGMLFVGPEAERRYGHRHFMDLTAVFTAPPQFVVISGRAEVGRTDPMLLVAPCAGPRLILLAGRTWRVTWVDWKRRRCFVEPADGVGKALWLSAGTGGATFELCRSMRAVVLGEEPPVSMTPRATAALSDIRDLRRGQVHPAANVVAVDGADLRWWTWAGHRANATLLTSIGDLGDQGQQVDDHSIRLRSDLTPAHWSKGIRALEGRLCLPDVDDRALAGLKFSAALPPRLAEATLAARLADLPGAERVLREPHSFVHVQRQA